MNEPLAIAQSIWNAVAGGQYAVAAMFSLTILVWAARKFSGKLSWLSWANTRIGGYGLVFAGSLAGAMATALLSGQSFSLSIVGQALSVAFGAIGGWETIKDLLASKAKPVAVPPPPPTA